jgi:hypothetical protein
MDKAKRIKQLLKTYSDLRKLLVDPTFKPLAGGAAERTASNFLDALEQEFGTVTIERMVDAIIAAAYSTKDMPATKHNIRSAFSNKTIVAMREAKRGVIFYQNQWLGTANLTREALVRRLGGFAKHPQSPYIYVEAEEQTKRRKLNLNVGYVLCQISTLGWSPLSSACEECDFTEKCKIETERKYPEIYRLRLEHGNTQK